MTFIDATLFTSLPFGLEKLSVSEADSSYVKAKSKIDEFRSLKAGWHFGKGEGASEAVAQAAVEILDRAYALGFRNFDSFPGVDGGIQVWMLVDEDEVSVRVNPEMTYRFTVDHDDEEVVSLDNEPLYRVLGHLLNFATDNQLCSSAYSTGVTTTQLSAASTARHLRHPVMVDYLSSTPDVLLTHLGQYVTISGHSIQRVLAENPYSGNLMRQFSPQVQYQIPKKILP